MARSPEGKVVFVAGALPGDHVRTTVTTQGRDYLRAEVLEVLTPSTLRSAPPCPEVVRGCGSCQWQHIDLAAQCQFKRQIVEDGLTRIARIVAPVVSPVVELSAVAYRTTLRPAVIGGRAGFRRARQNSVVAVESCHVAHPLVEDLLLHGHYGTAEEVILRCGARTGERLAATDPPDAVMRVPADVRDDHFHERVSGRTWRISARSFFQSRPDGAEALVSLVAAAADECDTRSAIDLYSGVGLFAGFLADRDWKVTAIESSRTSVADARVNLRNDHVQVVRADVTKWRPIPTDLVVANPSRRGLDRSGVATVVATGARRVVLVSCDVGAFARDARLLGEAGYGLTKVTPVDMFPHTFHVEVVSVFDI